MSGGSGGSGSASGANCSNTMIADAILNPFIVHFDNAHLSESPSQQASQAADANQYTQIHTVMAEQMLDPTTQSITGTYGC